MNNSSKTWMKNINKRLLRDTREQAYNMFIRKYTARKIGEELRIGVNQAKCYISEFKNADKILKAAIRENPLTYIRMVENELFQLYEWKHKNEPYNADRMRSLEVIYSHYKLK